MQDMHFTVKVCVTYITSKRRERRNKNVRSTSKQELEHNNSSVIDP